MKFNRNYYDISKWFLLLVGQWPYQKPKMRLIIFIAQFIICENTQCIFQTLPSHLLVWNCLVKLLTYRFNNQQIKDLTDHLFVDWDTLQTQQEREILKKYAENGRRYALIYATYCYVTGSLFMVTALVPKILDVVFPLNTSRPIIAIFLLYFFHMLITAGISLTGLIAHDCMFFIYIEHVCGLFAVVGFRFEHILHKRNNARRNLVDALMTFIVNMLHFGLFAKLLENTFTISFAMQLLIATIGLISMQSTDLMEATRYVLYILAQLFHCSASVFKDQKLIDHSLEICNKIYDSSWYEIPVRAQKLLLITMRKSIEASTVTAGKIYVLQTAMSYFTVLASFNK
ncbi:Odorant receptor 302 [Nylanderia fulva]|uniref:Odorant receptor n=1 Tax=Nylanderia fulva TaxID=613905 RepID=A0A6G1LQU6_9HYME|nr:Odorant receptor 302 [Nylanderia fulva]